LGKARDVWYFFGSRRFVCPRAVGAVGAGEGLLWTLDEGELSQKSEDR
jgi:hypothetical protein